jgi:ribosome biogenesis GTPase A
VTSHGHARSDAVHATAQVPLSSSNPELTGLLKQKRHIIVLNKSDLVPSRLHKVSMYGTGTLQQRYISMS